MVLGLVPKKSLADLGWPALPGGNAMVPGSAPGIVYQRLPDRADRPGLVGIRAETDYKGSRTQRLEVFWVNPAKSYLCVRHEVHQRKGQSWKGDLAWQPTEPESTGQPAGPFSEYDDVTEICILRERRQRDRLGENPGEESADRTAEQAANDLVLNHLHLNGPC